MKFFVNENCIGCEFCATTCPKVFKMTAKEGQAVAIDEDVTGSDLQLADYAMENCPASAIEYKD